MRCVIIDDEPLAVDIIENYLQKINGMEIVAKCHNPLDAITILNKKNVDLVFLDIEMPNLTGIDLVKTLDNIPQFIFTTAYPQYALEGFNLNAVDYLVKPIPFQRFLKAVSRAKDNIEFKNISEEKTVSQQPQQREPKNDFIFVKSEYDNVKINTKDIKYIQGLKDYIKIYVVDSNKALLTLSNFKDIQEKLPTSKFIRVHRSFIVNISFIKSVQKTKIVIDEIRIPIGETYKDDVLKDLGL